MSESTSDIQAARRGSHGRRTRNAQAAIDNPRPTKGTKRSRPAIEYDEPPLKSQRTIEYSFTQSPQNKTDKISSSEMVDFLSQSEIDSVYYQLSQDEKDAVKGEIGYAILAWAHNEVKVQDLKPKKPWSKADTKEYATLVQQFRRRGVIEYLNGEENVIQFVKHYKKSEWGDRHPKASKFNKCKNSRSTRQRKAYEAKRAAKKARKEAIETACGRYREPMRPRGGKDMTYAEYNWDRLNRGRIRHSMDARVAEARRYYEGQEDSDSD